jgi:hypothetical protein
LGDAPHDGGKDGKRRACCDGSYLAEYISYWKSQKENAPEPRAGCTEPLNGSIVINLTMPLREGMGSRVKPSSAIRLSWNGDIVRL